MAETPRTTVLLVDDQAIVSEMVRRILDAAGDASLHFCADSAKALEMAHEVQPTVILQDLSMPGIDGLDLLDMYQTDEQLRDVPVLVLSGREDAKVKAQALARGASDYIVKLPDPVELIARIRRHSQTFVDLLERRRHEDALRDAEQAATQASRAKSTLLANIGHELRTPLQSILESADVLKANAHLSEESARAVAQIVSAGADLTQLIERVLHASSVDGAPPPVQRPEGRSGDPAR